MASPSPRISEDVVTVSVITPSYNQKDFIQKTIDSVITQRGNFILEYIIVDGGSEDGSVEIIEKLAEQDGRIKWLSEPDNGQSDAINKGIRRSKGEILAFLNSDDLYLPGALQEVVNTFKANPSNLWAYGKCKIINKDGREIRQWITAYKNWHARRYSYAKLLGENFISQPATFWRREAMKKAGFFDKNQHLVMDYGYWLKLGFYGDPIFIDANLASFRYYPSSKSGNNFIRQFKQELAVANYFADKKGWYWPKIVHQFNYWKITTAYRALRILGQ